MVFQYVRFQDSRQKLPEHIEGPFKYVQLHHGVMEGETDELILVQDFASLNLDGTWNAGPTKILHDGYTDVVFYYESSS